MYTVLIILIVLASLLMIGIVLIQESKGGGLASNFQSANQFFGVRKTTNDVEKATWGLAILMVVLSIACSYTAPTAVGDQSVMESTATQEQSTNPVNTQGFGASQPAAGQQAPAAGQQAPAAGQQAPAAGQQAPAAGQQAPAK